ncbi:uncharacterized protein LOC128193572 [Vigna angularis]|uniref:uncharacterized protein LOC128193572 n=1 Tax=Phaseolus angularis TaxID=3914 RepID=UPI0022B59772|nr:uncharacterized protein LOC128193572 [Vigna angularis]
MSVFDDILNGVEHRLCLRHLYNNYKKKFGGGLLIRDLMMGAAKATFYKEWEKKMGELKNVNVDAFNWLMGIPTQSWCKKAFSAYPRCDVLINNLSESFNSTILMARDKPIISMIEWIRSYIMSRFASLREKIDSYPGDVMPKPRKRLDMEVEKSGNWLPVWAGGSQFEVTHGFTMDKFVVDLSNHTCTCYLWDLVGIPCRHAVAAIHYKSENPEHYVHPYYKKDAYRTCYAPIISPINGQQLWPTSESPQLLPPIYKRPPGRPKKLRRREVDEYVSHGKLSKTNTAIRCSTCNAYGHNVRTCKKSQKRKDKRGASTSTPGSASTRAGSASASEAGRGASASASQAGRAASIAGRGASASAPQAGRRSATVAGAGAASASQGGGSATMREGARRTSTRLAAQIVGSQGSCN